uniref:BSD domain-containing protein n=1 Tax=Meloidogyne enterolobii TaxID=390850 RepID=A0A6V7WCS7_MELEN|nr:unnamed protein product [Meloidogyne enterolobii]
MSEKSTDNKEEVSPDCNEEKKKDQASETATNESSSGNSWIPGLAASWVNTAKEKTISTFEMMKKDIHEFSDTLQQGANTLAGATVKQAHHIQNLIAPVPDNVANEEQNKSEEEGTSKQSSEETNKTCKDKSGLFNFGWMKQWKMSVPKNFLLEQVDEKRFLTSSHYFQMQNDPRTFTQAPQQNVDLYKEWLNDFKISEYNGEINLLLSNNPRLREIYAELVPSQVDNNAFWNRYFFKVHLKELDKQIAMVENPSLTKTDSTPKEGYSPAPSNGKDDWSMCSSGPAPEELDEENGREQETSTPRPQKDDEVDDWEECLDEANGNNKNEISTKNKD